MQQKAGYKTTEFWITVMVQIVGWLQTLHLEGAWARVAAIIVLVLDAAIYALLRYRAKSDAQPPLTPPSTAWQNALLIAAGLGLLLAPGCCGSEIHKHAIDLHSEFAVYERAVVPNPEYGPEDRARVARLGAAIRRHIDALVSVTGGGASRPAPETHAPREGEQ